MWSPADCRDLTDFYRRLEPLLEFPELSCAAHQHRCLQNLGLSDLQIEVVRWLEPTKWYSRLLGAQAMQARLQGAEMPQARPYQVDTPLNRVVDYLLPESLDARQQMREPDLQALADTCDQALAQPWTGIDDDLVSALRATREALALAQQAKIDTQTKARVVSMLEDCYRPYGEYMPALIHHLIDWVSQTP